MAPMDEMEIEERVKDCPQCKTGKIRYHFPPGPFYEICPDCLRAADMNDPFTFMIAIGTMQGTIKRTN